MGGGIYGLDLQALLASSQAVAERRGGVENLGVYDDGADFDVLAVMAERDSCVYLLATHGAQAAKNAAFRDCTAVRARMLMRRFLPALAEAELLLWKQEIWLIAVGADGSATAFENVPYRAEDVPPAAQYWGFDRDLAQSPSALAELGLPPGWICQSWALFPLPARSDPEEKRPFYLKNLDASEATAILLDRPSLMPVGLFNREMSSLSPEEAMTLSEEDKIPRLRFFLPISVGEGSVGPYDFLLAGLSFLREEFVEQKHTPAGTRAERRRIEGTTGPLPDVRSVVFRKAAPGSGDPSGQHGPYDCHFLVGAHWRKPSARMLEQRPVFVRSYVKGDTEKPFRPPREAVKVVKR